MIRQSFNHAARQVAGVLVNFVRREVSCFRNALFWLRLYSSLWSTILRSMSSVGTKPSCHKPVTCHLRLWTKPRVRLIHWKLRRVTALSTASPIPAPWAPGMQLLAPSSSFPTPPASRKRQLHRRSWRERRRSIRDDKAVAGHRQEKPKEAWGTPRWRPCKEEAPHRRRCTVVWNKQESRCKYWATRSSVRSFACTAHFIACSTLLNSLARYAGLIPLLAEK